jgi:threonine dehydrogenase-like Zn-dependent dehydrogenase
VPWYTGTVRALVFDLSIPKYLLARAVGRRVPGLFYGPGSCFTLREDVPTPVAPSGDFALLAPRLTGLCGSDLGAIFFKSAPSLSAFASLPAVFGHEILADVAERCEGSEVREGDRVVIDPWLSCEVRGVSDCARCALGEYATCERAGIGPRKGLMLGASRELPGGFGQRMVAHASQLFRVPDRLSDQRAVLTEPLSVAVHAVLRHPPQGAERVLVIGGGAIAFGTVWALRELYPEAHVTLLALEDYQLALGRALGAQRTVRPSAHEDLLATLGREIGSPLLRPVLGRPFLAGGYDRVFECVGSAPSLDDALRVTRAGGTVVLLGAAGEIPKLDWTFVWTKELHIVGTLAYGSEPFRGGRQRTFAITLELLTTSAAPIERLVTHAFPLGEYGRAIETNLDRRGTASVKTVLDPRR